jgi:hypothetical protein
MGRAADQRERAALRVRAFQDVTGGVAGLGVVGGVEADAGDDVAAGGPVQRGVDDRARAEVQEVQVLRGVVVDQVGDAFGRGGVAAGAVAVVLAVDDQDFVGRLGDVEQRRRSGSSVPDANAKRHDGHRRS